jgi:cyanate permease
MGIGVSIFLMAVGAILAFAVTVPTDGIELDTVGVILIILGLVGLLASLVWWDDWTPRHRPMAYDDDGDVIVLRRRPRVVTIDDADDGVVDIVEDRPVVERRRVTTRRTTYDGF